MSVLSEVRRIVTLRRIRIAVLVGVFLSLMMIGGSILTYTPASAAPEHSAPDQATNLTLITAQGNIHGQGAGLWIVSQSKQVVYSHTSFDRKYFDVEPINQSHLLLVAQVTSDKDSMEAVILNWRSDTITKRFSVPPDTHDVDRLSPSRYAVADKNNNRIYVFNTSTEQITWSFSFRENFAESAGRKDDYTHLNDIDSIENGSAFLSSPRNFDRVVAVDRHTRSVKWVLGSEDNYTVLNEQHNPALIEDDPRTVLVADSQNDRVIEYQYTGDSWQATWIFRNTQWPRDADRLPNGNTLIVDTNGGRVLEVTPDKEIVWEFDGLTKPYDIDRLQYGDEATGPHMTEFDVPPPDPPEHPKPLRPPLYYVFGWTLPGWYNFWVYLGAAIGLASTFVGIGVETLNVISGYFGLRLSNYV